MTNHPNNYPKLHNAAWPGVVGKGGDAEPPIDLDTMLDLTAAAEFDGQKFDGFDLFLFAPHVDIDSSDDDLKKLADKASSRGLVIGSVVAPVWPPTGGGAAMGSDADRQNFWIRFAKAAGSRRSFASSAFAKDGVVRIDSASRRRPMVRRRPEANTRRIADTFRQACTIADEFGERLSAEGEICWGGMHSWRRMVQLLEMVDRPKRSVSRPTWRIRCFTCWESTRRKTRFCRPISNGRHGESSTRR